MFKPILVAAVVASTLSLTTAQVAFAWHPKAEIVKKVQNITTNSALSDANTAADAVATKPGDVIKYVIEVKNAGQPDQSGYNDLHYTVLSDTLPAGVELVNDPAKRTITENLGVLKPGQKVTKEYQLKVTSQTNGQVIVNEACVDGDSEVKDNKQHDCDVAQIKVAVEPKKEVLGEEKKVVIPATGPEAIALGALSLAATGYAGASYARAKSRLARAHRR